jgi:Na+/melibiose symporter-like transporter
MVNLCEEPVKPDAIPWFSKTATCFHTFPLLCFKYQMKPETGIPGTHPNTGRLRFTGYINITIFGFALNALWNPMGSLILPLLVLNFAAESEKNSYLGIISLIGLLLAIVIQPVAGAMSDRSGSRWGRRRPYILLGAIFTALLLPIMGLLNSLALLLIIYCLLQISANMAHGPWQGLIPDMVTEGKRGRASGVKGFVEILGALAGMQIAGYFLSQRFPAGEQTGLQLTLGILSAILVITMIATVFAVKEPACNLNSKFRLSQTIRNTFGIGFKANSSFVFFLLSRFLFLAPLIWLRTFGLYFLQDISGLADPVSTVADLMIVLGICLLITVFPAGYLSDKVGRRVIVTVSGVIGAAGFAVLLAPVSYVSVLITGGLLGIANGGFMSSNWAMATDLAKKDEAARYLGLTNLATGGACVVASLTGPGMDWFNSIIPQMGYHVALVFCVLSSLASSILVLKIRAR